MNESLFINIIIGISIASVPLIFAAIGELLVERSGVLNLGVEGMMIVGALLGFVVMSHTQNPYLAVLSAMLGDGHSIHFCFFDSISAYKSGCNWACANSFWLGFCCFCGQRIYRGNNSTYHGSSNSIFI